MLGRVRARRGLTRPDWSSWGGRTGSCGGRRRSCGLRRPNSRRSRGGHNSGRELHRREQVAVRGQAGLQRAAGRPEHLLRGEAPPPSAHSVTDARLVEVIRAEHEANYGVDGARKLWKVVHRARHTLGAVPGRTLDVHRGLEGRGAWPHDTHFTDVASWAGFVHVGFVIDVYSGMIVGWRPARSMRTDLVTDTLATTSPIRTPRPSRPRGDSSRSRCCAGSLNPPPDPTFPSARRASRSHSWVHPDLTPT